MSDNNFDIKKIIIDTMIDQLIEFVNNEFENVEESFDFQKRLVI